MRPCPPLRQFLPLLRRNEVALIAAEEGGDLLTLPSLEIVGELAKRCLDSQVGARLIPCHPIWFLGRVFAFSFGEDGHAFLTWFGLRSGDGAPKHVRGGPGAGNCRPGTGRSIGDKVRKQQSAHGNLPTPHGGCNGINNKRRCGGRMPSLNFDSAQAWIPSSKNYHTQTQPTIYVLMTLHWRAKEYIHSNL